MDWWSIFRRVRRLIFVFIAIVSLAWTVILSFYLAKEWSSFGVLQRSIVLAMIVVNVVTVIVQYLMIVMVFKIWLDLARTLFLALIHVATSVLYTVFGTGFSCGIFESLALCTDVDIAFLVGSWVITGLLVGYAVYLLLMTRIPIPIPEITPNLLLHPNRRASESSFGSIRSGATLMNTNVGSTRTAFSVVDEKGDSRPASKALLLPDGSPMPFPPPSRASSRMRSPGPYGAIGLPVTPRLSRASSFRSQPLSRSPSTLHMRQTSYSQRAQAFGENRLSPPQSAHLPNPFWDPIPRDATPESVYAAATFAVQVVGEKSTGYLSPSQDTPTLTASLFSPQSAQAPPSPPSPSSPSSIYSLYSNDNEEEIKSGTESLTLHSSSAHLSPYHDPRVKSTISSSPPRTNTPSSFHSVAPSVHFSEPVNRSALPVHPRPIHDPVSRAFTASPRLTHEPETYLPNPFPPVARAATLRRYASINNAVVTGRSTPMSPPLRNALHLQGTPGLNPSGAVYGNTNRAGVGAGMNRAQWRQLVMNAASSG